MKKATHIILLMFLLSACVKVDNEQIFFHGVEIKNKIQLQFRMKMHRIIEGIPESIHDQETILGGQGGDLTLILF